MSFVKRQTSNKLQAAMSNARKAVTIKLELGDKGGTHRVSLARHHEAETSIISYRYLCKLALEYSTVVKPELYQLIVTYIDSDGDTITISNDHEFKDAVGQLISLGANTGVTPNIIRFQALFAKKRPGNEIVNKWKDDIDTAFSKIDFDVVKDGRNEVVRRDLKAVLKSFVVNMTIVVDTLSKDVDKMMLGSCDSKPINRHRDSSLQGSSEAGKRKADKTGYNSSPERESFVPGTAVAEIITSRQTEAPEHRVKLGKNISSSAVDTIDATTTAAVFCKEVVSPTVGTVENKPTAVDAIRQEHETQIDKEGIKDENYVPNKGERRKEWSLILPAIVDQEDTKKAALFQDIKEMNHEVPNDINATSPEQSTHRVHNNINEAQSPNDIRKWQLIDEDGQSTSDETIAQSAQILSSTVLEPNLLVDVMNIMEKRTNSESCLADPIQIIKSELSHEDSVSVALHRWDAHLGQMHQLGFTNNGRNIKALECVESANMGIGSMDFAAVVNDAVDHLLSN